MSRSFSNPPSGPTSEQGKTLTAFPDVCKMPQSPTPPIPIPYPNIAQQNSKLPPTMRHEFETKFGADLSDVEVHVNHAPTLLGANSFTSGNKIFLAPSSANVMFEGRTMAHEVAHVLQQRAGVDDQALRSVLDDNDGSNAND